MTKQPKGCSHRDSGDERDVGPGADEFAGDDDQEDQQEGCEEGSGGVGDRAGRFANCGSR